MSLCSLIEENPTVLTLWLAVIVILILHMLFVCSENIIYSRHIIYCALTLTMPNLINGIIHLQFFALYIINFRDIKMKT